MSKVIRCILIFVQDKQNPNPEKREEEEYIAHIRSK